MRSLVDSTPSRLERPLSRFTRAAALEMAGGLELLFSLPVGVSSQSELRLLQVHGRLGLAQVGNSARHLVGQFIAGEAPPQTQVRSSVPEFAQPPPDPVHQGVCLFAPPGPPSDVRVPTGSLCRSAPPWVLVLRRPYA